MVARENIDVLCPEGKLACPLRVMPGIKYRYSPGGKNSRGRGIENAFLSICAKRADSKKAASI
jgi:hypothetical protein